MATSLLDRYRSGVLIVEVRWATWELTVFEVTAPGHDACFVAVPRHHLDRFLVSLWSGALDRELVGQVSSPKVRRRRLADGDAVREVTAVGAVVDPTLIPPAERSRDTGRIGSDPPRGRRHKRENQEGRQPGPPNRGAAGRLGLVIGLLAAVVLVGLAIGASGGDDLDALIAGSRPSPDADVGDPVNPGLPSEPDESVPAAVDGQLYYEVTASVDRYVPTEASALIYSVWSQGDTVTFWLNCGQEFIAPGGTEPERECMPDFMRSEVPVLPFVVDGLVDGGQITMAQSCEANDPRPQIDVSMDGYGTDTIAGTYAQSYPQACLPDDTLPWPTMLLTFTGRAVEP